MSANGQLTREILREHAHTFSPWLRWMHALKRLGAGGSAVSRKSRPRLPLCPSESGRSEPRRRLLAKNVPPSSTDAWGQPVYPV